MRPSDIDLVERFTGQRQTVSVDAALRDVQAIGATLNAATASVDGIARRLASARRRHRWLNARVAIATLPRKFSAPAWAVGLVLFGIASFLIGLVLVFVIHAGAMTIIVGTLAPFVGLAMLPVLFPPDVARMEHDLAGKAELIIALESDYAAAQSARDGYLQRQLEAKRIYDGLVRVRDYPLERLLAVEFKKLSEPEFEEFLVQIFRFLNYSVKATATAGDQGIDMLIERGGQITAIQAKGNCASVGNSAVQEVHTGVSVYARRGVICQQCAVITASAFTAGAIEAARAVNCRLIAGDQIESLIRGQISL
jgi:hypothetical protein